MDNLNYCRQMVKQFTAQASIPSISAENKAYMSHCIDLARASQKFILPDGGRLYDDPEFKALDESEMLCLPFPIIAMEYTRSRDLVNDPLHLKILEETVAKRGEAQSSIMTIRKALLFARELDDAIVITMVCWYEHYRLWVPYPEVWIPRVGYINRTIRNPTGRVGIYVGHMERAGFHPPLNDYMDEIGALLCMLNVLSCKNVHIEQSHPKKARAAMAAGKKGALQFDSYHVLMIDSPKASDVESGSSGSHRSPREHLRRGHIRRLADGRRIWVNATVVAAGRGAGVVTKDYAVRRST